MTTLLLRIRQHLSNPDSQHRRIAVGFLWISLFVFVGKLAGAAKEMAIAWRYGVSETVDAYVFVFNLITWPVSVWFSISSAVLIPLVARLRADDPTSLPAFRAELLAFSLLLAAGMGVMACLGLPLLFESGATGLTEQGAQQALAMSGPLSLTLSFGIVISLFSAWMMAYGRHRNTLLEAIPALTILVALLLPSGWIPEPLVWGTVAGFALQMGGLAWPLHRSGELQLPRPGFHSPAWLGFWSAIGIMSAGQLLSSFTTIVDQFFAANLGPGTLSTLSYANRILALVLGMGAMAIGRATLPVFSETQSQNRSSVDTLALRWAKWMFVAGTAVALLGFLLTPTAVALLFERGAFNREHSESVATVLRYSLIQVPFYFSCLVLVSALASAKRYAAIAASGALNLFSKLTFSFLLVEQFRLPGLVLSTVAMYVVSLFFLYVALLRLHRGEKQALPEVSA